MKRLTRLKKNTKSNITAKSAISILLLIAFLFPVSQASPANEAQITAQNAAYVEYREEVVYANLDATGNVREINVVNILNIAESGTIKDFGDFSIVRNLTDTANIDFQQGVVTADVTANRFYYQGTLANSELPWNFSISYFLNGIEILPEKAAGQSGQLEIRLATAQNDRIAPVFFENYMLQIAIRLDTSIARDITPKGSPMVNIANAGQYRIVNFTILPGEQSNVSLLAEVTDFEMPSIEISALPFVMEIDAPDTDEMQDNLTSLTDAIATLNEGVEDLREGAYELNSGTARLRRGSSSFSRGLNELDSGSSGLVNASEQIRSALSTIAATLQVKLSESDQTAIGELPAALLELSSALDELSNGLNSLNEGFSQANNALRIQIEAIPDAFFSQEDIGALYMANPERKELIDTLVASFSAAQKVKGTYAAVSPAFNALEDNLPTIIESNRKISATLASIAAQTKEEIQNNNALSNMKLLSENMSVLSDNFNLFHTGLSTYTGGVTTLAASYSSINRGLSGIAEGTDEFYEGIAELNEGTVELRDETKDMPQSFQEEIDDMIARFESEDFTPVSFVSQENKNTTLVQFVLKTDEIKLPANYEETVLETKDTGFWIRLLNLFGL